VNRSFCQRGPGHLGQLINDLCVEKISKFSSNTVISRDEWANTWVFTVLPQNHFRKTKMCEAKLLHLYNYQRRGHLMCLRIRWPMFSYLKKVFKLGQCPDHNVKQTACIIYNHKIKENGTVMKFNKVAFPFIYHIKNIIVICSPTSDKYSILWHTTQFVWNSLKCENMFQDNISFHILP